MRKTIWKFTFDISDSISVPMPKGADILSVEVQGGVPCIWALVDPDAEKEARKFLLYGTGHPIDGMSADRYVATFQQGPFVWHLFE